MIDRSYFVNYQKAKNKNLKNEIDKCLKKNSFCILKNFFSEKKTIKISDKIFKFVDNSGNKLDDILDPQNFSIRRRDLSKIKSDKIKKKKKIIECFVNFNKKNKDIFNCKELFEMSVNLRNILYGFKKNKNINAIYKKKFITATRFMIYPHNGGFLEKHTDANGAHKTKIFKKYYNIVVSLTKIKKNFSSGGAFIILKKKKLNLEKFLSPGSALIYNEKIPHGVDKIICQRKKKQGKISAITNFYNI